MTNKMCVAEVRAWIHRHPRGFIYTQLFPFPDSSTPLLAVVSNKHLTSILDSMEGEQLMDIKQISSFELLIS